MRIFFYSIIFFLSINFNLCVFAKNLNNNSFYNNFYTIFEQIERDYVLEPDKQKMLDSAISGMLSSLDPHSTYFTDDDLKDFKDQTKGEFGGIGVEVFFDSSVNAIKVISPIEDLPAYRAGIKSKDYIVAVDDDFISDLGFNKAIKHMRGAPGTEVKLTIIREDQIKPLEIKLIRENVKIKAVKFNLDNEIAYLRIVSFSENTISELKNAMRQLQEESKNNLQGIVLDLRNNPGGLLDQAIGVSEYFLDSGIIVTTKGRTSSSITSFSANKFVMKAPKIPVVVLINGGSASASEIVSGALQDHKRGIILGTKSFGKGSVQTFYQINDRAGIKLTTAIYYTPSGRSIQEEGIIPDIIVEQAKIEYPKKNDTDKRFSESSLKNHLKNEKFSNMSPKKGLVVDKDKLQKESTKTMSEMYINDYQYARALDLIQGLNFANKKVNIK